MVAISQQKGRRTTHFNMEQLEAMAKLTVLKQRGAEVKDLPDLKRKWKGLREGASEAEWLDIRDVLEGVRDSLLDDEGKRRRMMEDYPKILGKLSNGELVHKKEVSLVKAKTMEKDLRERAAEVDAFFNKGKVGSEENTEGEEVKMMKKNGNGKKEKKDERKWLRLADFSVTRLIDPDHTKVIIQKLDPKFAEKAVLPKVEPKPTTDKIGFGKSHRDHYCLISGKDAYWLKLTKEAHPHQ